MHEAATIEQAREIAARFDFIDFFTDEAFAQDVKFANEAANSAMPQNVPTSYRADYPNSYRTGLRDPRETIAYWYAQVASDIRSDSLAANFDQSRVA